MAGSIVGRLLLCEGEAGFKPRVMYHQLGGGNSEQRKR
jgi:hypothetical protein